MTVQSLTDVRIGRLSPEAVRARADEIAALILDAAEHGADVLFRPPVPPLQAVSWVFDLADRMRRTAHVFAAQSEGRIVGTVLLVRSSAPNQPHRAKVEMLLVDREARRHGIASALMTELEGTARVLGITLLTIETAASGQGRHVCERTGWTEAGMVPGYTLSPDGTPEDAVFYYKRLD